MMLFPLVGCGAREPADSAPSRKGEGITDPIPSPRNAWQWKSLWDGKSWIVTWKKKGPPLRKERVLESLLGAVERLSLRGLSFEMRAALSRDLRLEIIPQREGKDDEGIAGFAFVSFEGRSPVWFDGLLGASLAPLEGLTGFEAFQWRALLSLPEAQWAEPNLESELFEGSGYNLPPEMQGVGGGLDHLKWIHADVAWEKAVDADGKPMYEYEKAVSPKLNWTNVAVIDTGVDWKHPDLWDDDPEKSRIFKNPREEINCVDDDGNGYIDDVHGIDATKEMEEWNAAALKSCKLSPPSLPEPGSSEVVGTGKPCESGFPPNIKNTCSHGTHVSGIIAAKPGGNTGTMGVCPSCRIVPIRVSEAKLFEGRPYAGRIEDSSQIRALSYLMSLVDANQAPYVRIINMSLGKYFISRSLAYMYRRLLTSDILVVAAAGNEDTDTPNYPAAYEPVLSVCATSLDSTRGRYAKAGYSNFGVWVDICAPGTGITSTVPGGGQEGKSGTSMASPVVAGAAGFMKSVYPQYSAKQISMLLERYSNAAVLYNFADSETNFPEGASKVNMRNYLYRGEFPDGTQFYMLGSGFLDLAASITDGKECWSKTNPGICLSYAYQNKERQLQSQLDGGCVMSSVAAQRGGASGVATSMPFLMLLALGARWVCRKKGKGFRGQQHAVGKE